MIGSSDRANATPTRKLGPAPVPQAMGQSISAELELA